MLNNNINFTPVNTKWIDNLFINQMRNFDGLFQENCIISAPLATYETALFHSVARGAKISQKCKTLNTTLLKECMTRSVILETKDSFEALQIAKEIANKISFLQKEIINKFSKYTTLKEINYQIVSNLAYIRFSFETGNASGHNMSTIASDKIIEYILSQNKDLKFISASGNFCTDKKNSAVNSILGRGKHVIAEAIIPKQMCIDFLRTTPEKIVDLNIKKNLIGSIISGSVASANAHFANMLLALYIATGQDGANVVEGSQGITFAEVRNDDLYFSVNLPNIIVGTIGHGKANDVIIQNLTRMNCVGENSAKKLAHIAAGIVWCGELSLMAALTNQNELASSHIKIERNGKS